MIKPKTAKNTGKSGSLKDIAALTGLSVSAVSRILNNAPNDLSSEQTKVKVREIATRIGYRQKFSDKLSRGETTHTAVILISQPRLLDEEHCQILVNELARLSNQRGFAAYWNMLTKTATTNVEIINELLERGAEHFIFIGEPFGLNEMVAVIARHNRNWITYGTMGSNIEINRNINSDTKTGTKAILEYFLENGLNDFKMLLHNTSSERLRALQELFPHETSADLARKYVFYHGDIEWIDSGSFSRFSAQIGYDGTAQVMEKFPKTQAIFYLSDYFALGGVQWLFKHGYKVGKDIVIAGYNDIWAVREHVLPIISVAHDITKIANLLIENLGHREPVSIKVKTRLIVRKADY